MSDPERPDTVAFRELEGLVNHLSDELAGFRRRALLAEARLREQDGLEIEPVMLQARELSERVRALEHENHVLKTRLDDATSRTNQMLERVRFIRQQTETAADR